jgi:putative ABC transport system substrate-binding protein
LGVSPHIPETIDAFTRGIGQFYSDFAIEARHPRSGSELLSELAADLVRLNVDVIFARGPQAVAAAKEATSSIPIVAIDLESDPIAKGFVETLARPGGNITGVFLDLPEMSGKQIELLKEVFPELKRVAILGDPPSMPCNSQRRRPRREASGSNPKPSKYRTSPDLVGVRR